MKEGGGFKSESISYYILLFVCSLVDYLFKQGCYPNVVF